LYTGEFFGSQCTSHTESLDIQGAVQQKSEVHLIKNQTMHTTEDIM